MKKFLVFVSFLVLMATVADSSPILSEKDAKQILRTRREDRPRKAGFPDEPMRRCGFHEVVPEKLNNRKCLLLKNEITGNTFCTAGREEMQVSVVTVEIEEYMLYLQRLEQRSEEQFLEHWLNPHCLPHCNRDLVHPI